ncbi:DUF3077 domain-containing protein [Pseudomonas sp. 14P_8.1_Bac3]|uniref:DUF3077 domain-containing protein n=1 Tax=Pseudomonas sp. 14P_8.1_Bac3 TaxID=2971621 RepID=UPI0021CA575B|nr:DUF3077 domain-containing protein [Pseudomonas sp. 14P_8.1_Bac3]MCU1760305.1 DUF3077 domain-containing protein [Pseudomonas sp. 14P_8.1_Bac3]
MINPKDLKTIGYTAFSYHGNQALFRISRGVPIIQALHHASDLLHISKLLASDAAMVRDSDRHAWASHFLQDMSKAIIDDVAKVLDAPCNNVT